MSDYSPHKVYDNDYIISFNHLIVLTDYNLLLKNKQIVTSKVTGAP